MPQPREVVITGLGVVCPIGVGVESYWSSLTSGKSGIDWLEELRGAQSPFRFAARVKDFDPKLYVQPRKTIKVMCPEIQIAFAAAGMAMSEAKLEKDAIDPERFGVVLGSELFYGELEEMAEAIRHCQVDGKFDVSLWGDYAFKDLFPLWMLKYLPNMAACHISIAHDARGPNNSIVEGGASSLLAINEATAAIERGHADAMLAGGSGSIASFGCLPFRGWEHLTKWEGEPSASSRPFEARRSGIVPGEGAGMLLLETREHAEKRGAPIFGRIAGYASRFEPPGDPWKKRSGQAIENSIAAALKSAKMTPADIGHVNAHGESSIEHDRMEAQAIRATLGGVPVLALKSYFGDLGAGSGLVELIGSILALMRDELPATLNYEQPDATCPVNIVREKGTPVGKPVALALSQSNTGQAAAVVIARD
jgi:3-oxoacyl-[acyl-carrier-protein] synthase II